VQTYGLDSRTALSGGTDRSGVAGVGWTIDPMALAAGGEV
jgi:hypothetical protein